MAIEFEFERKDGTGTVDLLDKATNDLLLIDGSYTQRVSTQGEWVSDTFRTIAKGATDSDVRTAIKALEDLLQEAVDWFKYPNKTESIWLRMKADTETARRTLIKDWGRIDVPEPGFFDPLITNAARVISEWTIVRHPDWEDVTLTFPSLVGTIDMNGGSYDLYTNRSTMHGGSEIARIEELNIQNSSGDIRELWVGFKPTGAAVTHDTVIPCEDADNNLITMNGSAEVVDATGVTGTVVETDFGGTIATRAIRFGNSIYPKEETMLGQWVVLLRAKLTASGEVMALLSVSSGTRGDLSVISREDHAPIYITSTNWVLYEMGTITLPPGMWRDATTGLYQGPGDQLLILTAAQLSGTPELRCDEWILIPYEHFLYLPEMDDDIDVGSPDQDHYVFTYEDDLIDAVGENIIGSGVPGARTTRIQVYQPGLNDWGYPRQGGLMVVAGNTRGSGSLQHVPTDNMNFQFSLFKRYKSYR